MKTILTSALVLLSTTLSFAEESENAQFKLDWKNKSTLNDNVVQMCDDTYYPAVEVIVPGNALKDFSIEMSVSINKGKISPGCEIKGVKSNSKTTTYILNAHNGGCTIEVYNLKAARGESNRATYEISDAC